MTLCKSIGNARDSQNETIKSSKRILIISLRSNFSKLTGNFSHERTRTGKAKIRRFRQIMINFRYEKSFRCVDISDEARRETAAYEFVRESEFSGLRVGWEKRKSCI
jgi:hypothetical protein